MLDRYALEPMKSLWSNKENKFRYWLKVELAVLREKWKWVLFLMIPMKNRGNPPALMWKELRNWR